MTRTLSTFHCYRRQLVPVWRRRRLVKECEAFVAGRYLKTYIRDHGWADPWVWLNTLAHADRRRLEALARSTCTVDHGTTPAQYLAAELLSILDRSGLSLHSVQRWAPVPLELRCRSMASALGPRKLANLVLDDLRQVAVGSSAEHDARPNHRGQGGDKI